MKNGAEEPSREASASSVFKNGLLGEDLSSVNQTVIDDSSDVADVVAAGLCRGD